MANSNKLKYIFVCLFSRSFNALSESSFNISVTFLYIMVSSFVALYIFVCMHVSLHVYELLVFYLFYYGLFDFFCFFVFQKEKMKVWS